MANEIVKIALLNSTGFPRRVTVADGATIVKGTALKLTTPNTGAASDAASAAVAVAAAGIASEEKTASDGITSLSVWTSGDFYGYASGAITVGNPLVFVHNNYLAAAASTASGAIIVGYALATATTGGRFAFRMRL
jgi:hypothetical protein